MSHEMIYKEWSGIRLGLASAMVLPCIYCLTQNKKGWFFFWVFIGAGIHYVGILSILIYWLQKKRKTTYHFLLLSVSILISQMGLVREILMYMDNAGIFPGIIHNYLISDNYSYDLGIYHPKILQQIFLLLLALYLQRNKVLHQLPYFTLTFNIFFLSTISYILLSEIAIFSARIGAHFYSVEPILIIYLSQRYIQKRFYLYVVSIVALIVSYINYVYRAKLPQYQMFTNSCIENVC
jgi:transmembrane protein EpsG